MKKFRIICASLLAVLVIAGSSAGAKASGAVNNDMVLGFLMGFAQNNTVQSGNFIGGLTSTALGGSVNSVGGTVTNVGNIVGSGGLTGGFLGGAFSGTLNATGINGLQAINTSITNPMNSIGTGFAFGQMMAGLNTNLATQGLSLGSIAGMSIPGLNGITGGVGTNTSIGAIVSSVLGQSATSTAITGLMNGGLLGNTLGNVTGGIQGGAANLLLNSLGLGTSGNNMGLSTIGQLTAASVLSGTSGISGLTGLANLNLLNSTNGGGLLGSLLSGGSSLTGATRTNLLGSLLTGGSLSSTSLFGSGVGGLTNASSLFASGQTMMQNATAVAQNLMSGNFLGAALQNAIGAAVGSAIGQTVNNALGSGLSGLLGMATGALSSVSQAVTGALGAVTGALGSMLGGLFGSTAGSNPLTSAAVAAASGAINNATNAFSNSLAGMMNCESGTPSNTNTNPTDPNVTGPTNIPTDCGQITFNHRSLGTISINPSDPNAQQQFARVMTDHNNGETCTPPPQLLPRIAEVQAQVAQDCTNGQCSAINVTSTYRNPQRQAQIRINRGCHPTQGSCPGVAAAGSSPHNHCTAMDLRFAGASAECTLQAARAVANRHGTGGVGYYGSSGHVHIDVGRRRDWGGGG